MKYFKTFTNNCSLGFFQGHLNFSLNFGISRLYFADLMRVCALLFFKFGLFCLFGFEYFRLKLIYRPIKLTALLFQFGNLKILQNETKNTIFCFFLSDSMTRRIA